jgi:hypothetical protein
MVQEEGAKNLVWRCGEVTIAHFKRKLVLLNLLGPLISGEATSFVIATKEPKRPSQHNPCHYTGHTPRPGALEAPRFF